MWRELGDVDELAAALDSLGWPLVYDFNDNTRALEAFEQSLELRRELGDAAGVTRALVGIAQVFVAMGETERAEAIAHDLLDRAAGDARTEHFAYHFLADCALIAVTPRRREPAIARVCGPPFRSATSSRRASRCRVWRCRRRAGNPHRALVLAASVEALWESLGVSLSIGFWNALLERYLAPVSASLGDEYDAVRAEGRALAFDDAVELALRDDTQPGGA